MHVVLQTEDKIEEKKRATRRLCKMKMGTLHHAAHFQASS